MADFFVTERIRDGALKRVIRHIKARHPAATAIYHDQFIGSRMQIPAPAFQLFVVGHGTQDGRIAGGATFAEVRQAEPTYTAPQFARHLRMKGLAENVFIRIKLIQCWGGAAVLNHGRSIDGFAQVLARTLGEMGDRDYASVIVGGYGFQAHWSDTRTSHAGRESRHAPGRHVGEGELEKISRFWYDTNGDAVKKEGYKSQHETVLVFFPFDYPTR